MEQLKWTTPKKVDNQRKRAVMSSPQMCITPVKQPEQKFKSTVYQKKTRSFGVLPCHITPPSGLTKFIARNPFEADLTNKLHLSVISPTVFSKEKRSPQHSPGFAWNIEEIALIQPANIDEFPLHQIHCTDPEAEIKAQAAIDTFFSESQIIPSPWSINKKDIKQKSKLDISVGHSNNLTPTIDNGKQRKEGWSQTVLSLPPQLPPGLEEALQPYFTFTQEQNVDNDDANSSTSSLRRKLFFNHEEDLQNNDESVIMSPVKMSDSLLVSNSPPQSGMLIHVTPVKQCSQNIIRSLGTPVVTAENLSPPDISPIHSTLNISSERVKCRTTSATRLDFSMDMSMEYTDTKNRHSQIDSSLDLSLTKAYVSPREKVVESNSQSEDRPALKNLSNVPARDGAIPHKSMDFEMNEDNTGAYSIPQSSTQQFRFFTDSCKMYTNEMSSVQQINSLVGISEQHSACNSGQDTGYQTYSLSSTTNGVDSYNDTPANQKMIWGHRILVQEEEAKSCDWKENMKNIFSSTPSRCNREKENHIF